MSVSEPAVVDHGLVVGRTHERVQRRKCATREHEEVRQLALADLEARERASLSTKSVELLAFRQTLAHRSVEVAEALERIEDLRKRLPQRLARRVTHDLRVERLLVWITDAREVRDLARDRLFVQALDVALDECVERAAGEHLDETGCLGADLVPHLAIRSDRPRDA